MKIFLVTHVLHHHVAHSRNVIATQVVTRAHAYRITLAHRQIVILSAQLMLNVLAIRRALTNVVEILALEHAAYLHYVMLSIIRQCAPVSQASLEIRLRNADHRRRHVRILLIQSINRM